MRLSIDHLKLHLRGISPKLARTAANGLGREILKQLVAEGTLTEYKGNIYLSTLEAGKVKLERSSDVANLQHEIAKAVTKVVTSEAKDQE